MDESKQPGIRFDNILLGRLNFDRKPTIVSNPELDVHFSVNKSFTNDKRRLTIELSVILTEKKGDSFKIECAMVGIFSIVADQENMSLEEFSEVNGPALMLPYIREVIANITMRSGIKPVILPPLNVKSVVQSSKEVTEKKT